MGSLASEICLPYGHNKMDVSIAITNYIRLIFKCGFNPNLHENQNKSWLIKLNEIV